MIKLLNLCTVTPMTWGLWFIIPDELQSTVIPFLKYHMHEVSNVKHRKHYRAQLTKAALKEKYGSSIRAYESYTAMTFYFYTSVGVWRTVGEDRPNEAAQVAIIESLRKHKETFRIE